MFYEKGVVMNQEMNMGMMMVCMVAGVLFSLAILAFVVIQTVLQARILKEVPDSAEVRPGCKFVKALEF